ncbi:MAG TPA: sigma-70 family RNA polymerase sigma factor [Gemmataceae bacterium]
MSSSAVLTSVRRLRGLLAAQRGRDESDEQLLHAFLSRRDDSAFAVLVHRHGPMVFHVCRRVLGHQQDAEDAFQATFLVLARNAASLRNKTSLASFLHGTAYRTAMKAKQSAARRGKHEGRASARPPVNPAEELSWREVRTLLDEEIARLPEKYRTVFILCHLENLRQAEVARRLGLNERTLSSRLTAARKRLQWRLSRRGVELTALLAASALATGTAPALPAVLLTKAIGGTVSPAVAALADSGSLILSLGKAKLAAVFLLAASVLSGAGLWAYRDPIAHAGAPPTPAAEPPADKASSKPAVPPQREAVKTVEIQGRVLAPDGKPKAGAKLLLLGEKGKLTALGASAADGRFTVAVPKEAKDGHLVAQADGTGIDFLDLPKGGPKKPMEFRLVKDRVIRGRIVNTEGKPAAGVRVAVDQLGIYANNSMDAFLIAWKKRHFMSGLPGGVKHIWSGAGALFAAVTDAEGRFVLRGLGDERLVSMRLSGGGIAEDELWIVNRVGFDPKPYNQITIDNIPKGQDHLSSQWLLYGPELSVVAESEKIIRGAVKDADTDKGRPSVMVRLTRREGGLLRVMPEARTDAQGRYEIRGARKMKRYMLEVSGDTTAGYVPAQVWAADSAGYEPIRADIAVKKGVIITGKMLDGATGKPVAGHAMAAVLLNNPFVKDYPAFGSSAWFPMQPTNADGIFRVVAIPGPVLLMGGPNDFMTQSKFKPPAADPKYPQYFDTRIPNFASYYNYDSSISPIQGSFCKVLEIKPDAKIVEQDIRLERASALPVQIQDGDGKPLAGVWVAGSSPQDWYPAIQCKEADCSVYQIQPEKPRLVIFFHPARKLAGAVTLKGDEKPPVVVKLRQAGAIVGRLLDADGKPLAGVVVGPHYRQRAASEIHRAVYHAKQIVTDANGAFTLDDLISEQKFELSFRHDKRIFEHATKPADAAIQVKPGECRDLGAIKVKLVPEKTGE